MGSLPIHLLNTPSPPLPPLTLPSLTPPPSPPTSHQARLEAYHLCEEIYREIQAIQAAESDPVYLLENVPVREATGEPWVLKLEMVTNTPLLQPIKSCLNK